MKDSNRLETDGEPGERLRQHAKAIRHDGDALARSAQAATADLGALARDRLERSPYVTLGAAFAAGWVLGGGITVHLVTLLAGAGTRVALGSLSRTLFEELGGSGQSGTAPSSAAERG